jgi:hypothetical protein
MTHEQDRPQLSSRPPATHPRPDMDAFLSGTQTPEEHKPDDQPTHPPSSAAEVYPWDAPSVREDITKVYNLRFPEPYLLKLKYIAEHTPDSMQAFCLDLLLPAIDRKIEEIRQAGTETPES